MTYQCISVSPAVGLFWNWAQFGIWIIKIWFTSILDLFRFQNVFEFNFSFINYTFKQLKGDMCFTTSWLKH